MGTFSVDINELVAKFGLTLLVYFGSYGTPSYRETSDIDIAFLSEQTLDGKAKLELLHDLIVVHQKSEIDLVDLRTAEPILRCEIALKGRNLYEKEEGLFERYSLYYIKRFYELQPVIQAEMVQIRRKIREVVDNG